MKVMIFAAGRGARMRPLSNTCPKPLLKAGDKTLIEWQIEALVRAGFTDIIINHAWLGQQIESTLGDGCRFGAQLQYSAETEALETAGAIRQALPLLLKAPSSVFLAVSSDIVTNYDYRTLRPVAAKMAQSPHPLIHLVMVPNPPFLPEGNFVLNANGKLALQPQSDRLTFGSIGLYDVRLFTSLPLGEKIPLTPLYHEMISSGQATGELFQGEWHNIGTPKQLAALNRRLEENNNCLPLF